MAAPAPRVVRSNGGTGSATLGVILPTDPSLAADVDSIVVALATDDVTHTPPTGFTLVQSYQDVGNQRVSLFRKTSDGTESGTTVNFTAGSSTPFAAVTATISGAGTESEFWEPSDGTDGSGATITPDLIEATGGRRDYLLISVAGWQDDDAAVTAFPDLYVAGSDHAVSGGGTNAGMGCGMAFRRLRGESDTPGTWTLDQSEGWATFGAAVWPTPPAWTPPDGVTGIALEAMPDTTWEQIDGAGTRDRDALNIRHGGSDWSARAEPAQCRVTLDNRDGTRSPHNPTGPLVGSWRKGMPFRAGVRGDTGVENPVGNNAPVLTLPHASADNLAGDFDFRAEFRLNGPFAGSFAGLVAKIDSAGGWAVRLFNDGDEFAVRFSWVDGGATLRAYDSTANGDQFPWWMWHDRAAIRVTLVESSGDVSFGYARRIDDAFTTVATVNTLGPTSITYSSTTGTAAVEDRFTTYTPLPGRLYRAELRDDVDGTEVFSLDLRDATPGISSFEDDTARTWTVGYAGRVTDTDWRFHGEVSSLPVVVHQTGLDSVVALEAAGPLRRLRRWSGATRSPLRRSIEREAATTNTVAYWPMEDVGGENLAAFAAVIGTAPLGIFGAQPNPASDSTFVASAPLPTLSTDSCAAVVTGVSGGEWMVRFNLLVPDDWASTATILTVYTGDLNYQLRVDSSGNLQIFTYRAYTLVHTGSNWAFAAKGTPYRIGINVEQNGTGVDVGVVGTNETGFTGGGTDTFATATASAPYSVQFNQFGEAVGFVVGHLTVEDLIRVGGYEAELGGNAGETAAQRIARLCDEESVPISIYGDPSEGPRLGPQPIASFASLLDEAADTDLGILADNRRAPGLFYRTGRSMQDQEARYTVDWDTGFNAEATGDHLELPSDDNQFANDVTVTNWDGGSARAELTAGPLNTAQPPEGAGRTVAGYPVSVENWMVLDNLAGRRLQLRTTESPRLLGLRFGTRLPTLTADEVRQILDLELGARFLVVDLPDGDHPDDLGQILRGVTETITSQLHDIDVNSIPSLPWDPAIVEGTPEAVYQPTGSVLATAADEGDTTLYVHSPNPEALWTTSGGDLPLELHVAGAPVTVTAISGSASPQTFTVSAIGRDLPGGALVTLARPTLYTI